MIASSDTARTAEENYSILAQPPSYVGSTQNSWLNDLDTKSANRADKALLSTPNFESDADTVISTTSTPPYSSHAPRSVLSRGLQVPTRFHTLTSGFKLPTILERAGVTPDEWSAFTSEVKQHATLTGSQWAKTIAGGASTLILGGAIVGWFAFIPAGYVGHKMRRDRERRNFTIAEQSGALSQCVARWNNTCFQAKRLLVRIDVPGRAPDLANMDLASSKLFKYQQSIGAVSGTAGSTTNWLGDNHKQLKYQLKEGKARVKAAGKCRIVIVPLDHLGKPYQKSSKRKNTTIKGLDGAQDEDMSDIEMESTGDGSSAFEPLLTKRDRYPDEPKP